LNRALSENPSPLKGEGGVRVGIAKLLSSQFGEQRLKRVLRQGLQSSLMAQIFGAFLQFFGRNVFLVRRDAPLMPERVGKKS